MSNATIADLESCTCGKNRCWRTAQIRDANVIARIGAHWRILLLVLISAHVSEQAIALADCVTALPLTRKIPTIAYG